MIFSVPGAGKMLRLVLKYAFEQIIHDGKQLQSMKSLITVLMPVYNSEKYLEAAIESILQQTYADFEFLIIDDGSTDNTQEIVLSYDEPRIQYLKNDFNRGITYTLNKGIDISRTKYIARMDADDISYPKRFEKQMEVMDLYPECAMVSCWAREINDNGEEIGTQVFRNLYLYYNLTFECWVYHPTVIYKKEAVEAIGKYQKKFSEDFDLFWRISRHYPIFNIDEVLLDYRISDSSLCKVLKKNDYDIYNRENVWRNLKYYMGEDFILPPSIFEALRHNFTGIMELSKVDDIIHLFRILDQINHQITNKEACHKDISCIKEAMWWKKRIYD
jgi:glycosyltransferase involved in cell wall biosynthesis